MRDTKPSEKLFEIAPHKLKDFHTFIEILKNIPGDEVIFSVSDQGLQVSTKDERNIIDIILRFPASFFYSFTSGMSILQFQLSLEELVRAVQFWREGETVVFELSETEAVMRVGDSPIPVTIADGMIVPDPIDQIQTPPYLAEIAKKDFIQTMTMFAEAFPEDPSEVFPPGYYAPLHPVVFEGNAEEIHFKIRDKLYYRVLYSIHHPITSSGRVHQARNFYPIEFVKKTLIITDTLFGDRVPLEFGNNTLLRIQHTNEENIELTFLIGPMAEFPRP